MLGTLFGRPSTHRSKVAKVMHLLETGDPTCCRRHRAVRVFSPGCARDRSGAGDNRQPAARYFLGLRPSSGSGRDIFSDAEPQFLQVSVLGRGNFSASEVNELVLETEREILIPAYGFINTQTALPGWWWSRWLGSSSGCYRLDQPGTLPESEREMTGNAIMRQIRERTRTWPAYGFEILPEEQARRWASRYRSS